MNILYGRSQFVPLVFVFLLFPLCASFCLRLLSGSRRSNGFALCNLAMAFVASVVSLLASTGRPTNSSLLVCLKLECISFPIFVSVVVLNYWLLGRSRDKDGPPLAIAYFAPIALLLCVKYVASFDRLLPSSLEYLHIVHVAQLFLGVSYLSFRLCHIVQEVRNGVEKMPSFADYLSFAFYVPGLASGPITPYSTFIRSFRSPDRTRTPIARSIQRLVVGAIKYIVISTILTQFTYSSLILDGHLHSKFDLLIALFGYTLYLYNNFSGYCDMVVGASGLVGIEVTENFNQPFLGRNIQEFWNRWHISLSSWLRDMMFAPLVKVLARRFRAKNISHVNAFAICVIFVVIGMWHGVGVNFAIFGLINGIGLAIINYSTIFLKKRLGREGFAKFRASRPLYWCGVVSTFVYFSFSLFFFANSWSDMLKILKVIV